MAKKKILMRTGLSPFENLSEKVISDENLFGNNVGNLLYAFSLFRWLMTDEDTQIVPDRYRPERGECSEEERRLLIDVIQAVRQIHGGSGKPPR